jgi:hypothetical protein
VAEGNLDGNGQVLMVQYCMNRSCIGLEFLFLIGFALGSSSYMRSKNQTQRAGTILSSRW